MKTCAKCGAIYNGIQCPLCKKEATKKWRESNKEHVRQYNAEWYLKNAQRMKNVSKNYRLDNPEKWKAAYTTWRLNNPMKRRLYENNRRAKINNNGGRLSPGLADKLFALQRGKCACCSLPLGKSYQLDHIVPLSIGGANKDWNIQLLRASCNSSKKNKHPVEFMQSRGFLL